MLGICLICRHFLNLVEEAIYCLVLPISFLQAGGRSGLPLPSFIRFFYEKMALDSGDKKGRAAFLMRKQQGGAGWMRRLKRASRYAVACYALIWMLFLSIN